MEIHSFKINGTEEGKTYEAVAGELLKLQWDCADCDFCVIYPYNWNMDKNGELEVCIYETMTFILRAGKDTCNETVQKKIQVNVSGGEVVKAVDVSPLGPTAAGTETKFVFDLAKTGFGYLDHGIGRVEGGSYSQILNHQYSTYRYDVLSGRQEIQFDEKTVKAGRKDALELTRLKYVLMQNGGRQQYELSWRVENNDGKDVIIEASDQGTTFDKSASGHASFSRTGGEIVTLSIRCDAGEKGGIYLAEVYPFEIK